MLRSLYVGGVQTEILTPAAPPPPREVQSVEEIWTTFGPNLAPQAPDFFFWHTVGGKNLLHLPCVCSKCSECYGEFKYACKPGTKVLPLTFPPQPPPPPPPPPRSGCWDRSPSG